MPDDQRGWKGVHPTTVGFHGEFRGAGGVVEQDHRASARRSTAEPSAHVLNLRDSGNTEAVS